MAISQGAVPGMVIHSETAFNKLMALQAGLDTFQLTVEDV